MTLIKNKHIISAIPYVIIGLVFYLLDSENLFVNDDLCYAMNHATGEPVRNLLDALQSQCYDWFNQNGRFIIHTIVQCFCGFIGTKIFWIVNTIVFLLWLRGLVKYTNLTLGYEVNPLGILLLGAVLMVPAWHITNLGYISGAINYLWGGCAYLWFIIFYLKEKKKHEPTTICLRMLFALLALLVGSLQESFCIGIAGYFLIYYILHIKELKGKIACIVIGFCIGAAICVLAPANFARLDTTETKSIGLLKYIAGIVVVLTYAKTLILVFVTCAIMYTTKKYRAFAKEAVSTHILIISASIINALFVAIIAYTGAHQLTGIELFSLLVLISIIYKVFIHKDRTKEKLLCYACYIIVGIICIPIWQQRHSIASAYNVLFDNAINTKDGIVVAPNYMNEITLKRGWIRSKFVRSQEDLLPTIKWLSAYITEGKNENLIISVLPLSPKELVNICVPKNFVSNNVYKRKEHNFYIIRKRKCDEKCHIEITRKVTMFGAIRNRIQRGTPYEITQNHISPLFSFVSGKYRYFIELDDQNYPIQRIKTIE